MQLIQIGETKQKTVLDFVMEMSERQMAEMDQLKQRVLSQPRATRTRRGIRHRQSSKLPL